MGLPLAALVTGILLAPCLDLTYVWICLPLSILIAFARPKLWLLTMALLGSGLRAREFEPPPSLGDAPVRIVGVLTRAPQWRGLGVYLDVELQSVDAQTRHGRARLTEFLEEPEQRKLFDALDLGSGDRVEILVRLRRPVAYRDPGVFDFRRHFERQGIYWTGTIRSPRLITVLSRGWHGMDSVRDRIETKLEAPFQEDPLVSGLVLGMVLGQQQGITADAQRQFQASGLYHLVVVSGFNLAVVAGAASWLARILSWKRQARLLLILASVLLYATIVEGQTPVLRAALMVCFFVAARWLDRDHAPLNATAATAFIILLFDPTSLEDSSFQMTFAAVLAILALGIPAARWAFGWLREALREFDDIYRDSNVEIEIADWRVARRAWCELYGFPSWVITTPWTLLLITGELLIVSLSVESVFLFFMVESFHRISIISPLLNLPAGLVASVVTPLGLLIIALPSFLGSWIGWFIAFLLQSLMRLIRLCLLLPGATVRAPSAPLWLWVAYAGVIAIVVFTIFKRRKILTLITVGMVGIIQGVIAFADFSPPAPNKVTITFLDVGEGDSILIEFPSGKRMLVDGGGVPAARFLALQDQSIFSIGENVVSAYLFSRRIRRLDAVLLTHAHHDHMDGLFDVISNFAVGEVWLGRNPMIPRYRQLIEEVHKNQTPIRWVSRGQRVGSITILHPPDHWRVRKTASNNDSVVFLLTAGPASALFTGDIEQPIPAPARVDLLKVAHHGSKGVRLRTEAGLRVISVGANNPFGHPDASALPALRTDLLGAITVTLGGENETAAQETGTEIQQNMRFQIFTGLTESRCLCKIRFLFNGH